MQQSSSGGCLVKKVVTEARQERQKSAGVEASLGAEGPGGQETDRKAQASKACLSENVGLAVKNGQFA